MLKTAGYLNIVITIAHLPTFIWPEEVFQVTGIAREMHELSMIDDALPFTLTGFVMIIFLMFGLYGLSGAGVLRPLPFLRPMIFVIAGIYLLRGAGELFYSYASNQNTLSETLFSLVAIGIGLLYLSGGLKSRGKQTPHF